MTADPARGDHPVVVCAHGADSSGAVQLGALLAGAVHQRLVLASPYRYEPVGLGSSPLPSSRNEARYDAALSQIERAERVVPRDVSVDERPLAAEHIPVALGDLARDVDACALVLGRDLEGHVTQSVIADAPCPVAVSPFSVPLPEPEPLQTIGVAYDGSPGSRSALAAAAALGASAGALVRVIAVGSGIDDAEGQVEEAQAGRAIAVEVQRRDGPSADGLVQASEDLDLLVCGSRGRGRVAAAVLGSVSSHLVRAAHCPVLLVPAGTAPDRSAPLGVTTAAA